MIFLISWNMPRNVVRCRICNRIGRNLPKNRDNRWTMVEYQQDKIVIIRWLYQPSDGWLKMENVWFFHRQSEIQKLGFGFQKKMKETSREKQVLRKQGDDFNQISDNRIYNCYMLNTFAVFSYLCCYQRNKVKGRKYIWM